MQLKNKQGFIAPSSYFGRYLAKIVEERLNKNVQPNHRYKVMCGLGSQRESPTGAKYLSSQFEEDYSCRFMLYIELLQTAESQNNGLLSSGYSCKLRKTLPGWIEYPFYKQESMIDVFFNPMENVTRDLDTALAMVML